MLKEVVSLYRHKVSRGQDLTEAIVSSSCINFVAKVGVYLRYFALTFILGYQLGTDAFFLALSLASVPLICVDSFDSLGIPILIEAKRRSEAAYLKQSQTLLAFTTILTALLCTSNLLLATQINRLPLGFNAETKAIAQNMLFLLTPFIAVSLFFCCLGAICRADRRFHLQFIAEAIAAIVSLVLTIVLLSAYKTAYALPVAMCIGSFIGTIYIAKAGNIRLRLSWSVDRGFKVVIKEFILVSFVHGVVQLLVFVDKLYASYLSATSVSALSYASMIALLPRNVMRLENIFITPIAESQADPRQMRLYTKGVLLLTIPMAAFMSTNAEELVRLMFGYGAMTQAAIQVTAQATSYLALSVPLIFLWLIYYRALQVLGQLRTVLVMVGGIIVLNAVANYVFAFVFAWGLPGLPLGTLVAYSALVVSAQRVLQRLGKLEGLRDIMRGFLYSVVIFAVLGYALKTIRVGSLYLDVLLRAGIFAAVVVMQVRRFDRALIREAAAA